MGARRKDAGAQGEMFARPLWDACRDMEIEFGCYVKLELVMSGRKGIVELRLAAYQQDKAVGSGAVCAVAADWPNASYGSLPAEAYALTFKLGLLLNERRLQEAQLEPWSQQALPRRQG